MNKIINTMRKFGVLYTFFLILEKLDIIKETPFWMLKQRQRYYSSLSIQQQKSELSDFYENLIGKKPNLDNPKTFTEKLQWLKFNDSTEQKALLSDKYEAPKIIEQQYGSLSIKIIPQLGVWERAEDIDFDALPQKFVLKCTHGSAMNIIVKDKSLLDIKKTRKKLNEWLALDFSMVTGMFELHYKYIKPRIIAEKFIEETDGNLHDYKFHCFHGKPKFIELIGDRIFNSHEYFSAIYTTSWEKTTIGFNGDKLYDKDFPIPQKLDQMLILAKKMSQNYEYVRVDFYYLQDEVYFGEMTFTPDAGMIKFNDDKIDVEWGTWIKLN
ncbi:MAG: ATP-grasp fold amidoligase family protein [Treponema sp.]|nr:ATP-grasp fold amidoligase family protein [Treponema sp.]